MLQTTLSVLLHGDVETTGHNLYLVKNGIEVLYVGQAGDIRSRLRGHLGSRGAPWGSLLGKAIEETRPYSDGWEVNLYTVDECAELTAKWFPRTTIASRERLKYAEDALIHEYNPCYNRTVNCGYGIDSPFRRRMAQERTEEERRRVQEREQKRERLVKSVCDICGEQDTWVLAKDNQPCGVIEGAHGFKHLCHNCNEVLNLLEKLKREEARVRKVEKALMDRRKLNLDDNAVDYIKL